MGLQLFYCWQISPSKRGICHGTDDGAIQVPIHIKKGVFLVVNDKVVKLLTNFKDERIRLERTLEWSPKNAPLNRQETNGVSTSDAQLAEEEVKGIFSSIWALASNKRNQDVLGDNVCSVRSDEQPDGK